MRPELTLLVWAVLLTFVQMLIAVSGATLQVGLPTLAGNREGLPPCTGWAGRAGRAFLAQRQDHGAREPRAVVRHLVELEVLDQVNPGLREHVMVHGER